MKRIKQYNKQNRVVLNNNKKIKMNLKFKRIEQKIKLAKTRWK